MTTFTTTNSRCDRIIALIDECLAEVNSGRQAHAGTAHPFNPSRRTSPARSFQ